MATDACESCSLVENPQLQQLRSKFGKYDFVVALAGNPNTGKSTVFNALTGLRQHTGNWPGKTIGRAEGGFSFKDKKFKLIDLPGTYSLQSQSPDEEVARDFILKEHPDVTVVVCDASALATNLNLVIQIRQLTGRVVVVANLMDEAHRNGLEIDFKALESDLGAPIVPMVARRKEGQEALLEAIYACASTRESGSLLPIFLDGNEVENAFAKTVDLLEQTMPQGFNIPWIALRLLQGDEQILREILQTSRMPNREINARLETVRSFRAPIAEKVDDAITSGIFSHADRISQKSIKDNHSMTYQRLKAWLDTLLIGKWTGIPIMACIFGIVLWLTIAGANVPSAMLADLLIGKGYTGLSALFEHWGVPLIIKGLFVDGIYLTVAWVISVMLPPMTIFFPLFTLLEDFGYLPRVAFNLDGLFKRSGAHGKQALTMAMGYGCNAAGVIAARIIESPRERLIAIITNNFALCNGRWPTQILIASVFIGALVPAQYAGIAAAGAVGFVALLGIILTFATSWGLSKTVLRGEVSAFTLELPPYRPPQILETIYKSVIDRTIFVLWRAIVFALPAGAAIWLVSNIHIGDESLAILMIDTLESLATIMGLTGVILLAYMVAIPANEIVVPTILMLTVMQTGLTIDGFSGAGIMFETDEGSALRTLLEAGGWTTLTAICLMIFSLCHNPCSTTIFTIYRETRSWKWTAFSTLLPTAYGLVLCVSITAFWKLFGG